MSDTLLKSKQAGGIGETIRTIVYAILIALLVRTVAFEPFNIPSGSMIPTLLIGDYLFVSKYSYGYSRYSMPFGLPLFSGRTSFVGHLPERGDVIVFKWPRDNSTDYIKRLIGLPGDKVQMKGGLLYINGAPVKRERIEDFMDPEEHRLVPQYIETLPNGVRHRIIEKLGDVGQLDNTPEFEVPQGQYFMMGDNRDFSSDSRVWGPVPAENLIGPAKFLFFSIDSATRWWEIWKWPLSIRYDRLFNGIH